MRDPARIDRIIEKLRTVWTANPDLRLGQLLVNVIRPSRPCPQVFAPEDTLVGKGLDRYPDPSGDRYTDNEITLGLTKAEGLVLLAFLLRFRDKDTLRVEHEAESQVLWDLCALLEQHLGDEFTDRLWPKLIDDARKDVQGDEPQVAS